MLYKVRYFPSLPLNVRQLTEGPEAEPEEGVELILRRIPSHHFPAHSPHFLRQVAVHHSVVFRLLCISNFEIRLESCE